MASRIFIGGAALLGLVLIYWCFIRPDGESPKQAAPQAVSNKDGDPPKSNPALFPEGKKAPEENFLEAFGKDDPAPEEKKEGPLTNEDLEKRFQDLEKIKEAHEALVKRVMGWKVKVSKKEFQAAEAELDQLRKRQDKVAVTLQKEIARAREARPADPVVQWLTAELLIYVGAEPELIFPYLQKAEEGGLKRPQFLASLARTQTEANRIPQAYQTAARALELDPHDRYVWQTFARTAFHLEHFDEVARHLDRAFPEKTPEWAAALRRDAVDWQSRWLVEQKLRAAQAKADDLPRVRIQVEHRRFARSAKGGASGMIESTGTGEFIVELFEDEAPASVANFLTLVAQKAYDGTRFHLAEPAALVAGGDPQSRTGDPLEDGTGGPGYLIPDEYTLAAARQHFRGSLSMANLGPHSAGSQFFLALVPNHALDGQFTVFGRVIKGMEVVDAITRGRTNPDVGSFGQIIPGDLLLRAEVVRKRPHEYRVTKVQAK